MNIPDLPFYTPRDLAPLIGISERQMRRYFRRFVKPPQHARVEDSETALRILKTAIHSRKNKLSVR